MMNVIFLVVALLGATLVFGPGVIDAILAGISSIDFVSVSDLVVFGIMMAVLAAMSFAWAVRTSKKHYATERVVTLVTVGVVAVVYAVLICSLWADIWLVGYREWTVAVAKYLEIACYGGWLLLVCSLGWCARAICESHFKHTIRKVDSKDSK